MAIGTGAAIIGASVVGAVGASKASKAQAGAARSAAEGAAAQYDQTRADLSPYREAGEAGLQRLQKALISGDMSKFEESPDYQFRLEQGQKAIERSAASRGRLVSGRTLKELQRHGSGEASAEYGNYISRLQNLAMSGQNAAAQTGTSGMQAQQLQSSALQNLGAAQAAGYSGVASNVQAGMGGLMGLYNQSRGGAINASAGQQIPWGNQGQTFGNAPQGSSWNLGGRN